jgi:cytochrome o ubiquinol oxidase operon protein cyoD
MESKAFNYSRSLTMYVSGFILSLLLTGGAYLAVTQHISTGGMLIAVIVGLAIAQVLVQLYFFLHLGEETKPRWKLAVLLSMLGVLGILVFGSLWIMQNLNYNMMSPQEMNVYMIDQNSKGF